MINAYKKSALVISGLALAVGLPTSAWAQSSPAGSGSATPVKPDAQDPNAPSPVAATPTADQTTDNTFGDIVVTARRREEQLQKVPLAITAFSARDLATNNVTRMENLTTVVPGLTVSPSQHRNDVPGFAIRGQRQDAGFLTNDPSVGIYIAEAVQARNFGLAQSLFDMESVQVLKGPQGTLFGRNTTGGAILFQPKVPDLTSFGGYVQARLGNYDRADALGVINIPFSDTFGIRVGLQRTYRRGYVYNLTQGTYGDGENTWSGRFVALFKPSSSFSNTLYVDHVNSDSSGGDMTRLTAVNPALAISATLGPVLASQQARLGFYEVEGNYPDTFSRGGNTGVTNVTVLGLSDDLTLKNIANYRDIYMRERYDLDGTALSVLALDQKQTAKQYTEELQLQGTGFDKKLKWILGAYYFNESGTVTTLTSAGTAAPNPRIGIARNVSKSVFAQIDYNLTPQLSLTVGGRYTWDERRLNQQLYSAVTGLCTFCAIGNVSNKAPTYTVSLNWQIDPNRLVYVATRRGYRSGGFNSSANNAASLAPFLPEQVTDYEVGLKADWTIGGAPLRTNIAVYHSNYKDIQRTILGVVAGVPVTTIFNAAAATIDGGEFEANFRPVRNFELVATAAVVRPHYTSFIDGTVDRSGNTFAYIPHETYRLGFRWTALRDSNGGELIASSDLYRQTSVFQAEYNTPLNLQPAYNLLSARLEYSGLLANKLTVAIWARNITKTKYYVSAGDSYSTSGYIYRGIGEPRTFGGDVTFKF